MNLLVTGGAGFIGSNFVRYWLDRYPDDRVLNVDLLTYVGNLSNLRDVAERDEDRYTFVHGDIGNVDLVEHLLAERRVDAVVNFAAESHNSRAVLNPASFFQTNVLATQGLMEACRRSIVTVPIDENGSTSPTTAARLISFSTMAGSVNSTTSAVASSRVWNKSRIASWRY